MPPRSRIQPGSTTRRPKVAGLRQHAHAGVGHPGADLTDAPDDVDAYVVEPAEAPEAPVTDRSVEAPETTPDEPETAPDEPVADEPVADEPVADRSVDAPESTREAAPETAPAGAPTTEVPVAPASTDATDADTVTRTDAEAASENAGSADTATDTATGTATTTRPRRTRGRTRMSPRPRPSDDDTATASPMRTAAPTRAGGRKAAAEESAEAPRRRFVRLRAALSRFAGSRALPITLVVAVVVCLALGGLAFWRGREAWTNGPVSNQAVIDVGGTAELVGQSREAIEKIFSYDFDKLDDSANAARTMSTGEFTHRYLSVFDQTIRQPAQEQKLKQTATVVNIGVVSMGDDHATVMALTQFNAQRTTTGQSTNAPGLLRLEMQRVDGRWKLAELSPLTAKR